MKRASTSAPSSPMELVSSASVASAWLCESASHSAVMPFSPMPFLLKSAAWHLRRAHLPIKSCLAARRENGGIYLTLRGIPAYRANMC